MPIPTRVLVAPQEFKGSLAAVAATAAIADGVRATRPGWELDVLPMSDGGPGFIDAIATCVPSRVLETSVHDPIGRPVTARYLVTESGIAVIEAAQANGLVLLAAHERDPLGADTFGVGQLILAALSQGPRQLLVGVGGSATTDGGAGMAKALGATFTDMTGRPLGPGGGPLAEVARIDWRPPGELEDVEVVVATDITNPLTGPLGAAAVYAPQKGASPEQVDQLEASLVRYAAVLRRSLGADVERLPGGGAAGGLAAGLVAFLGARIESGFDVVAKAAGLLDRVAEADVIVTGEGRFDSQSLQGKTTGRLLALAAEASKPCIVFAGQGDPPGGRTLANLEADAAKAMANAGELLRTLAAGWAAAYPG